MPATNLRAEPPRTVRRPLLSIAEVADLLGVNVRHVRRLVQEKRIPYVKWGHLIRFDPDAVEAWIAEHSIGATLPFAS